MALAAQLGRPGCLVDLKGSISPCAMNFIPSGELT